MPAPTSTTYSAASKVAAHTALLGLVDAGSAGGRIKIRTSADALLGTVQLQDPSGTVNGTTGQLTMALPGSPPNASATGTAAYAEITDSNDTVIVSFPAEAGTVAVSGKLVLNTLSLVSGAPFSIVSAVIG